MFRWQQTEFVLKGIYLGLLLYIGLQQPTWQELSYVGLCMLGGFVLFMGIGAILKLREGFRPRRNWLAFFLFLALENPGLVYSGILIGEVFGALLLRYLSPDPVVEQDRMAFLSCIGGGAVLGLAFYVLRHFQQKRLRFWIGLALALVLGAAAISLYQFRPETFSLTSDDWKWMGQLLLLGIPPFYLLTFASLVEESEVEIAAICAALGIGLWIVGIEYEMSSTFQSLIVVLPIALYVCYTFYVLPGLRVFKHVLRGMSYASVGRFRWALISLGRAHQLDPNNSLANEALWSVHRDMDFDKIAEDKETMALVNFELCLDRVASLLHEPPTAAQLEESRRLLDFIASQDATMLPRCDYWRAVAFLHEKQFPEAAECLTHVIGSNVGNLDNPHRVSILVPAWRLALSHPRMKELIGDKQLQESGRRVEAILAMERESKKQPNDADLNDWKAALYQGMTEEQFREALEQKQPVEEFDYQRLHQRGMELLQQNDTWQRGAELLRMAAYGLRSISPSIFVAIAQASEKAGDIDGAWRNYEMAKQAGKEFGPKNLTDQDREKYFQVVKMLADAARESGEVDKAVENYRLYTESGKAGLETYRALAELNEKKGDVWTALHCAEHALTYDSSDAQLVEMKDRYYYSVTPQQLKERWDSVHKWFDNGGYCLRKAKWLLDKQGSDPDILDWANHLLELASVMNPESISAKVLRGRVLRQRGMMEESVALLEKVRANKPESFSSGDEEEAWYNASRILGDIYINEDPAKALECFLTFRSSPRSGADTLFKLGVCYEKIGDRERAAKCYENVLAYDRHPRASEAQDALYRLKQPS